MKAKQLRRALAIGSVALSATLACPAWADKPSSAGGEHGNKHGNKNDRRDGGDDRGDSRGRKDRDESRDGTSPGNVSINVRFGDKDRARIVDFYQAQAKAGHCPPGLAKKKNGCQPPGQAKQWARGKALAKSVDYRELPYDLRVHLPAPPSGHRYVQVAGDILLIAVGTGMVIDAVEDLLR